MDAFHSMDVCGHVTLVLLSRPMVYDTKVNIDLYLLVSNMSVCRKVFKYLDEIQPHATLFNMAEVSICYSCVTHDVIKVPTLNHHMYKTLVHPFQLPVITDRL